MIARGVNGHESACVKYIYNSFLYKSLSSGSDERAGSTEDGPFAGDGGSTLAIDDCMDSCLGKGFGLATSAAFASS
jgi:hypothetical protein